MKKFIPPIPQTEEVKLLEQKQDLVEKQLNISEEKKEISFQVNQLEIKESAESTKKTLNNYGSQSVVNTPESSHHTYFTLSSSQLKELKQISEKIFKLANKTLLDIIKQKKFELWMESRYGIVKSLWENGQTGINLMRIDFAWDQTGNLKVLELNTTSHSGWIKAGLVEKESAADKIGIPLAPQPLFYAKYVLEKLGSKIAIMVKGVDYSKELDLLLLQLENLGGKGRIIILSENAVQKVINFAPTGLFWRCHAALVEHSELVLKLAKLGLPQLSSFESLFISGDKSFLASLWERDITGAIPKTYVLSKSNLAQNLSWLEKDQVVLKPGDLARGEKIFFGKNFTKKAWEEKIKEVMNSSEEWILQELCYLSKNETGKYHDIIVFLADGKVQGIASRVSDNEIVNVAKGGYGQAVVLCSDEL